MLRPTSPRPPNATTRIVFGASKGGICKLVATTGRKATGPIRSRAVGAASGEPIAASVRLAWPDESPSIAELQRRSWAVQWPAELAELMLASVSLADMIDAWRSAIERPPEAAFRVLIATDGERVVGFATTMPSQDDDADRSVGTARSMRSSSIPWPNIKAMAPGCSTPAPTPCAQMDLSGLPAG